MVNHHSIRIHANTSANISARKPLLNLTIQENTNFIQKLAWEENFKEEQWVIIKDCTKAKYEDKLLFEAEISVKVKFV